MSESQPHKGRKDWIVSSQYTINNVLARRLPQSNSSGEVLRTNSKKQKKKHEKQKWNPENEEKIVSLECRGRSGIRQVEIFNFTVNALSSSFVQKNSHLKHDVVIPLSLSTREDYSYLHRLSQILLKKPATTG